MPDKKFAVTITRTVTTEVDAYITVPAKSAEHAKPATESILQCLGWNDFVHLGRVTVSSIPPAEKKVKYNLEAHRLTNTPTSRADEK